MFFTVGNWHVTEMSIFSVSDTGTQYITKHGKLYMNTLIIKRKSNLSKVAQFVANLEQASTYASTVTYLTLQTWGAAYYQTNQQYSEKQMLTSLAWGWNQNQFSLKDVRSSLLPPLAATLCNATTLICPLSLSPAEETWWSSLKVTWPQGEYQTNGGSELFKPWFGVSGCLLDFLIPTLMNGKNQHWKMPFLHDAQCSSRSTEIWFASSWVVHGVFT